MSNLIGGTIYEWTLEEDERFVDLTERVSRIRAVNFRQLRKPDNDFEVQALTLEAVKVILAMADQLVAKSDALVDVVATMTKQAEQLKNLASKTMEAVTKHAAEDTITENESFILGSPGSHLS